MGVDFRIGGYLVAKTFSNATSGYPPVTVVLCLPFTLLSENSAVLLQMAILVLMSVGTAHVAGKLVEATLTAESVMLGPVNARRTARIAATVGALWVLLSYGFLLAIERADFDAYAALLMVLGFLALRRSRGPWLPTLLISLALNIKVYPAVLLLLVIRRYGWRSVVPFVVINTALNFAAGPKNLTRFVHDTTVSMTTGQMVNGSSAAWWGNQSAWSFSRWLDLARPWYLPHLPQSLLLFIPVAVLLLGLVRLWRRRDETSTLLLFCCMTPVMCLVPSISHDYKTVILGPTIVVMIGLLAPRLRSGALGTWVALLLLLTAAFSIGRARNRHELRAAGRAVHLARTLAQQVPRHSAAGDDLLLGCLAPACAGRGS